MHTWKEAELAEERARSESEHMRKVVTDEEVPGSVFFQKNYLVEEKKWQTEVNKETEERGSASTWVAEGKRPSNWGGWDADQSLGITGMELRQLQRSLATVRVAVEGMSRGILSARRTGVQEMGAS